jgi:hypothetical protein
MIPFLPEWGLSLDIVPLRLSPGLISISFLECAVGTDLRYPFRVLLLDATLVLYYPIVRWKKEHAVMFHFRICTLLLPVLLVYPVFAGNQDTPGQHLPGSRTEVLLETSIQVGKSVLFHMPDAEYSRPFSMMLSLRFLGLIEPSVTVLLGRSIDKKGGALHDRVLSVAAELSLTPEFRSWYRPSIGMGFFYSEIDPYETEDRNLGLFCSLTLCAAAADRFTFKLQRNSAEMHVKPLISVGTVRFGPLVPWGRRWSENSGNYYMEIELLSVGVMWW